MTFVKRTGPEANSVGHEEGVTHFLTAPISLTLRPLENALAVHIGRENLGRTDLVEWDGQDVAVDDDKVRRFAVLERAGLVDSRRLGREVRYAIRPERLDAATGWLARVAAEWDDRLGAIKRPAESSARERERPK